MSDPTKLTEEEKKLDAMRMNVAPADAWIAANDAVDEAALAIEIADGLVLGNGQRRAMLTATLRAISRQAQPSAGMTRREATALLSLGVTVEHQPSDVPFNGVDFTHGIDKLRASRSVSGETPRDWTEEIATLDYLLSACGPYHDDVPERHAPIIQRIRDFLASRPAATPAPSEDTPFCNFCRGPHAPSRCVDEILRRVRRVVEERDYGTRDTLHGVVDGLRPFLQSAVSGERTTDAGTDTGTRSGLPHSSETR